jgi:hypothetical protein
MRTIDVQPRVQGGGGAGVVARAVLGVACVACAVLGGCQTAVFLPDEPRSQFDRLDQVRERRAPAFVTDEFGSRRPNIRGRLVPVE